MFSLHTWLSKWRKSDTSAEGIDSHTGVDRLARFAAMPKLVDEHEFAMLSRESGFDRQLIRKLRTGRRRAYRLYLAELTIEYRAISTHALEHAANDETAVSGFAEEVFKSKMRFEVAVFLLRASTCLSSVPIPGMQQWTVNLLGRMQSERLRLSQT